MDTNSKSWKAVVSFICFCLGSILLLVSILMGVFAISQWDRVSDIFQEDYQNTNEFKRRIAYAGESLLTIAEQDGTEKEYESDNSITDPNLLCEVWVNGSQKYRSNPDTFLLQDKHAPEGYNFYYHDNGTDVTVTKDGKELDASSFFNLRNKGERRIDIYLAAPKNPVNYIGQYSHLYGIVESRAARQYLLWICAIPVVGLILFAVYIILNKDKKRADMALAYGTGRIWAEFKLILTATMLFMLMALGLRFTYWPNSLLILPFLALGYLFFNDLRYNGWHNIIHQSLCATLARLWRCEELKRPVEKRLQRRAVAGFVTMCPFAIMSMWWGFFDLFPWAWVGSTDREGMFIFVPLALLGLLGLLCLLAQIYFLRRTIADAHLVNEGMEEALAERMKSERMKVELITNVSHDLKTPLTSIISYVELLSREEGLPDHVNDYISILGEKSERLKTMVQEVFEVSKAATGNLPMDLAEIDLCKLIRQTLADMAEPIEASGLTVREQLVEADVPIRADGSRIYRVFQNLIQNALQYSLDGSRIYVTLKSDGSRAVATVRNTSRDELPSDVDFTGRFVRGDESRTDGGSGLGLSIAKTFTDACGGAFRIEVAADLFTAIVEFPTEK